jgi:hypothetical protein
MDYSDAVQVEEKIYENILNYLNYHDLPEPEIDIKSFVQSFQRQNWATLPINENFVIAMVGDKGKAADTASELFVNLNKYILNKDRKVEKEVLILYRGKIPARHIITPLDKKMNDEMYKHVYFYRVDSKAFLVDHTKSVICDKQEVITDPVILQKFKDANYIFAKTLSTDPGAVWYRAKVGDIIKVTRVDDKCTEIMYREVVDR